MSNKNNNDADNIRTSEVPVLKVGIISDIQGNEDRRDWGMYNLGLAFDMLAGMKTDVLLVAGDLADHGVAEVYRIYNELLKEKFGDNIPKQVFCDGNHDFWIAEKQDPAKTFSDFCGYVGQSEDNPYHINIKGYDFIALSTSDGHTYTQEKLDETDKLLERLTKEQPGKPVFVLTHFPPKDTVSGSHNPSGITELLKLFEKYPEVVSFSGHTHYPLEDERTLWQGAFNAIETSTLSYGCIEEEVVNTAGGVILPFAREVIQMLTMDIYEDRLEVRRYNVADKREIAPDKRWKIPLPYTGNAPDRRSMAKAPEFAEDAQMLIRYDYGFIYLIFDATVRGDFAQFYEIEISAKDAEGKWSPQKTLRYVSNFYRLTKNRDTREFFKFPPNAFGKETEYLFRVYPVESFGKKGKPLEAVITIPASWWRDTPQENPCPQE